MSSEHTSKIQAILKVAHAKKQAAPKVPLAQLLQFAKSRRVKKANATPPSLYCRLAASMAKTAEQEEKGEATKAETSKPESSKSEPAKPTETTPKSATPKPTTHAAPKPATCQDTSRGFDLQSILSTIQPYAAPTAVGTGVGTLGALMIPQGTRPGESAQQYQRRQRQRMMVGGLAGGGTAAALLAAYNAYKARKGMVVR